MADPLLTVRAIEESYGISADRLYQLRHQGKGPRAIRFGGPTSKLMFRKSDFEAWLAEFEEPAGAGAA
jgi:predicted DNA-binding transcriptional regulator AlpA